MGRVSLTWGASAGWKPQYHHYIINFVLNKNGNPLSTCMHCATPSAYLDHRENLINITNFLIAVWFQWIVYIQVSKNGKHLPQLCCLHYTICQGQWWCEYSFLASTTFQQPGNSQIKWTQKEWTQTTPQTTQCSTVETWEPCLVAERLRVHAEVSLKQFAIVTLHRTWKQCNLDFKEGPQ